MTQDLDRRAFIKGFAVATLVVQIAPLARAVDSLEEGAPAFGGDSLLVTSTEGLFGHVHQLAIPLALLDRPPEPGISLETTRAFLHRHSIRLSAEELLSIGAGGSVTRTMSSHRITICRGCAS